MVDEARESSDATGDPGGAPLSLFYPLAIVGRHRRLVIAVPVLLALALALPALLGTRSYTAFASFTPQTAERSAGGLASLAAQFGVVVGGGDAARSPRFYADLISSSEILRTLALESYPTSDSPSQPQPFLELVQAKGDSHAERLEWAVERLERMFEVTVGRETGVVRVAVTRPDAVQAQALVDRTLEAVNDFNLRRQQSQAGQERQFVAERLAESGDELKEVEDNLQRFLQQNREFRSSPELLFEYDRLQRAVAMQQQVVTALAQSLEQARIEEVRNTPVITIIESPIVPVRPDPRGTIRRAILGLFLGFTAALTVAFLLEFTRLSREEGDPAYDEMVRAWRFTRSPKA